MHKLPLHTQIALSDIGQGDFVILSPMPILTPQLLDNFPYSQYADAQSIQRGRAYYKDGRVWNVELVTDHQAVCLVQGDSNEYEVTIEVHKQSGELSFDCDCPYAEAHFCKQIFAQFEGSSDHVLAEMCLGIRTVAVEG